MVMRRFIQVFLVLFVFFPPAEAVKWPDEPSFFGVPGTDESLKTYASHIVKKYPLYKVEEEETPTLNKMGTTMEKIGPFPQKFIDFAATSSHPVLSVGEGTGNTVKEVLDRNITFIANDMDPRHLGHLYVSIPENKRQHLYLKAGKFPDEVSFPESSLGAIYFGRVLHFMNGEEIEKSLKEAYRVLTNEGKIFARSSSPFQKHLQFFIPIYEERVQKGERWPGLCTEMEKGWPTLHQYLPPYMNLLDENSLRRALTEAGFEIEELSYTAINHPDFKLDGKEGIGFIAKKRQAPYQNHS